MLRHLAIVLLIALLAVATLVYAATFAGGTTVKRIGGGTASVAHCQVQKTDIAASDTISSVTVTVECDATGSYNVTATVTSGASGSGTQSASLTAGTPSAVGVTISPSVTISGSIYSVDADVNN